VAAGAHSRRPCRGRAELYAVDPAASHVRIHLGRSGLLKFLGHDHETEAPIAGGRVEVLELRRLGVEPPSVAGVVKVGSRFRLEGMVSSATW